MTWPRLVVCVLLLGVASGCASVEKVLPRARKSGESEEVKELRERVLELQQRATMAEVELDRLRRQIASLEEDPTGDSDSPGSTAVETASPEEPSVEGAQEPDESVEEIVVEEIPVSSSVATNTESSQLQVYDLAPVPGSMPDVEAGAAANDAEGAAGDQIEVSAPQAVSAQGQKLYDHGYTLFHQGRYLDAETKFQQFLSSFGDTDLGDNAQFWIGESRYARQDLSGALAAYREVVSRYPTGNKVPDSLLKAADCHRGLGDLEGARRSYQEILDSYPTVAAAAVAEDRLRELE